MKGRRTVSGEEMMTRCSLEDGGGDRCTCYLFNVEFVYPGRAGTLAILSVSILVGIGYPSRECRVLLGNLIRISVYRR